MDRIVEQIQSQEITTTLRINEGDDDILDNVHMLIDMLKQSNNKNNNDTSSSVLVESIYFGGDFLGCLRNDIRSELLQSLPSSTLRQVHFSDALLQISDIANIVVFSENIEVVSLRNIVLQGIVDDFDTCAAALYLHKSLKSFDMDKSCIPAIGPSKVNLETLIDAATKKSMPATLLRSIDADGEGGEEEKREENPLDDNSNNSKIDDSERSIYIGTTKIRRILHPRQLSKRVLKILMLKRHGTAPVAA